MTITHSCNHTPHIMDSQHEQPRSSYHLVQGDERKSISLTQMSQELSSRSSLSAQVIDEQQNELRTEDTSDQLSDNLMPCKNNVCEVQQVSQATRTMLLEAHNGSESEQKALDDGTHDSKPSSTSFPEILNRTGFSKLHKLSTVTTVTFVLACLAVPCSAAFLGFLWSNPHGTSDNPTWLSIVLSGWTLKSVTISTLVLRTAVSTQAV
jgi:hypothetical protein